MAKNILEIIDRIKNYKGLKDDDEVANALRMTKSNLSSYKTRGAIPFEHLSIFCEQEGTSLDWLITGEGEPKKRYPPHEEKPLKVAEKEPPIYNDKEIDEIVSWIKENPQDRGAMITFLKFLKSKKEIQEIVGDPEGNLLKKEG